MNHELLYELKHLGSADYLRIDIGDNFSFPSHLHQCYEIFIACSGETSITINNINYVLKEKEAVFIFPNQIHSIDFTEGEHILCIFSPHLVKAYTTKVDGTLPKNNQFHPHDYLINSLYTLSQESIIVQKGILYSLCGQFDQTASYVPWQADREQLLYNIFSFIETEFTKDCSLSRLAAKTGYDYTYLSRLFKRMTGISFNSYVNHYRLNHACYLMENSSIPIIQCALESGYSSLRSFNRNFKSYFQITPTQYRSSIKNKRA